MGMMKEFRDFAVRGNVVDMAVGVVIGGAFGKIISSLVENIIMPPIGMIMGGVDFSNRFINLGKTPVATLAEAKEMNVPVIAYGQFLNTIIDFLIIAFVIFLVVRQMNRAFPKEEAAPRAPVSSAKNPLPMMRPAVHTAQLFLMKQSNFFTGCLLCFCGEGFLPSFLDPVSITNYNKKICERGGIGRRTGFRILRLAHKGSSPFARTIFHQSKDRRIFLLQ